MNRCVSYVACPVPEESGIIELARALDEGEVDTLVILGGNPVYTAPADLDWLKRQRMAGTVIRLGDYEDETFRASDLHLPKAHFLESWGDGRARDGTVLSIQPLTAPLFGGITDLELLGRLCGLATTSPYEIVRETFRGLAEGDFEHEWYRFLRDGYLRGSAFPVVDGLNPAWEKVAEIARVSRPADHVFDANDSFQLVFVRDYKVDDGRYANNAWLQELPDPVTKITWGNVVGLGPGDAARLGLVLPEGAVGDVEVPVVRIELAGRTVEGPAWVVPGMADRTVAVALGYGRTGAGRVGNNVGFNAYAIRSSDAPHFAYGVVLTNTNRSYPIACTQWHTSLEGRAIVGEIVYSEYRENPESFRKSRGGDERSTRSLYPNPVRDLAKAAAYQWGMV
ncbi:MAG: hydrogenase, partial [Verrucomicrobiae bacterium]|nr:hydrogenase [Verrucomicrobiae bacterium]